MNVETIKTGKCPVCGSTEVYDNRNTNQTADRKYISVSAMYSFSVEAFVCMNCGYFKEFITDESMKNEKLKEKVREKWNKTDSMPNAG
jgi:C4-type Zn-finger protein